MPRAYKKNFARGTKLSADIYNANMQQIAATFGVAPEDKNAVRIDQMSLDQGKFSLTFNWPRLIAEHFAYTNEVPPTGNLQSARYVPESQGIYVPFLLPPLQEVWNYTSGNTTQITLKSLSIGFDNYMDNTGVRSETAEDPLQPIVAAADVYTMNLQIREKDRFADMAARSPNIVFSGEDFRQFNIAPKVIWQQRVEGILFNGDVARFNPFFVDGIDKQIENSKTYLLKIDFPKLYEIVAGDPLPTTKHFAPISLTLSLNFETQMVKSDRLREPIESFSDAPQNYPILTGGQAAAEPLVLATATPNIPIAARLGAAGSGEVQQNFENIDKRIVEGLKSGKDLRGYDPAVMQTEFDSSYFAMAIPMFNGWLDVRASDLNTVGLPDGPRGVYGGDEASWPGYLWDHRLIPISQPFTIHHVFAVHDVGSHFVTAASGIGPGRERIGSAVPPAAPTFVRKIGVGIASGLRSESKKYQQVAYLETDGGLTTGPGLVDMIIDGVLPPFWGNMTNPFGTNPFSIPYDQLILQVPLVDNLVGYPTTAPFNVNGYAQQGTPFYVGKSDLNTRQRTDVGVPYTAGPAALVPPATNGEELYLDLRWLMEDSTGLSYKNIIDPNDPFDPGNLTRPETQYIGTSGCWIYVIGKKYTVT